MITEMIKNRVLRFSYKVHDVRYRHEISSNFENQHCVVIQDLNDSLLSIRIIPKCIITIESLELKFKYNFTNELVYVNGYQSWTDSKEFFLDEKMKTLSYLAKPLLPHYQFDKYGDYNFKKYSNKIGDFHGYTYGYIRSGNDYHFTGSLSEKEGYTIINTSASAVVVSN